MDDVDKLHRNGRIHDGYKQEIIVRLKTHSAKESVYRARKKTSDNVRIRPSLPKANKTLLHEAREVIEDYRYKEYSNNPPEAVFANIHGDIQVKFAKESSKGMFVTIKSLEHLSHILYTSESNVSDGEFDIIWDFYEDQEV